MNQEPYPYQRHALTKLRHTPKYSVLVEAPGLEPGTFALKGHHSTVELRFHWQATEDSNLDLALLERAMLPITPATCILELRAGIEPASRPYEDLREPLTLTERVFNLEPTVGAAPTSSRLQGGPLAAQDMSAWSWRQDLNLQPDPYQGSALPTELRQQIGGETSAVRWTWIFRSAHRRKRRSAPPRTLYLLMAEKLACSWYLRTVTSATPGHLKEDSLPGVATHPQTLRYFQLVRTAALRSHFATHEHFQIPYSEEPRELRLLSLRG